MKRKILLLFYLFGVLFYVNGQTPANDQNWVKDENYSEDFTNSFNTNLWHVLEANQGPWGNNIFRPSNVQFGYENGETYLKLIGTAEYLIKNETDGEIEIVYYTGGVEIKEENQNFQYGYGYYEIEARVSPLLTMHGLWPAFWTTKGPPPESAGPPYWYEEMDIFEPGGCQVINGENEVGYWHPSNLNIYRSANVKEKGVYYGVNMYTWHKYALEWLPDKLVYYFDDKPFFHISYYEGDTIPFHLDPNILLDLQMSSSGNCLPPQGYTGPLGSYDVNYFKYYRLNCSEEIITENQGNYYNFYNYTHNIKQSCVFKNSSIPIDHPITIRASESVLLKENFTVPLGAEFGIYPTPCFDN